MTKFDWEKDPYAKAISHQKQRQTQKDYLKKKAAKLIKKEKELQAPYQTGVNVGREQERDRISVILNQLDSEWRIKLAQYMQTDNRHEIARYRNYILAVADFRDAITDPEALIKGDNNER